MAINTHITTLAPVVDKFDKEIEQHVTDLALSPGSIKLSSDIQAKSGLRTAVIQALSGLVKKETDDVSGIMRNLS